jgi:hypothetical protein
MMRDMDPAWLRRAAPAMAWVVAATWLGTGLWAFVAPRSFFDAVATFPPYNVHFLHDIGAFSIGLGAVIVLALVGWSALRSVLVGVGIGSTVHVLSHVLDYDVKPSVSDVVGLSLLTAMTFAAAFAFDGGPDRDRG